MMAQPQVVIGFFENVSEAQQAVQLLLGSGFTPEALEMSAQPIPDRLRVADEQNEVPLASSGRFFSSLYSGSDDDRQSETRVTIQARSASEGELATDLLTQAGAVNMSNRADAGD